MTATTIAIVKLPSQRLAEACELTFIGRAEMSFDTLRQQHLAYREALLSAGAALTVLDADDALADSAFVEDTAVVLDEVAIVARPGTDARRAEPDNIEPSLARHRSIERILAPATLEGGDVMRIGRKLFVGRSTRTNDDGIAQLANIAMPYGYTVVPVNIHGSLHLKTACTALDGTTVLLNPDWLDASAFENYDRLHVDPNEPFAANVLRIGNTLIANAAYPRTLTRVQAHANARGLDVLAVDISEFGKAEAGLTCMSLVFERSR